MDKSELEKYKSQLAEMEAMMTDDVIKDLSKEEIQEYIVLVSKIKARLDLLENL